jgi:hypothetical protein
MSVRERAYDDTLALDGAGSTTWRPDGDGMLDLCIVVCIIVCTYVYEHDIPQSIAWPR